MSAQIEIAQLREISCQL